MSLQITVTHDDPEKPTEIITVLNPQPTQGFKYDDVDGDWVYVNDADIDGTPGVYVRTSGPGCSIPLSDLDAFIDAIRSAADRANPTA